MRIHPRTKRQLPLYLMVLFPMVIVLIYSYGPMFGMVMAFQRFDPAMGFFRSPWVGLDNFHRFFAIPDVKQVIWNTFYIATLRIIVDTIAAILVALLLNEVVSRVFKRTVQTIIYFPFFLSWVILGGIFKDILARDGLINRLLAPLGVDAISFLGIPSIFPWVLVITATWQITGFGTIVFLAAISNINMNLYEAASIDGAGKMKQTWHITIPGMMGTIVIMLVYSMGYILNAGFEQILMLYSPMVYSTGDVIDTWVYRAGLQNAQFSLASTIGLMRSVVSFVLIALSYYFAYKIADYRIF